MSYYNLPAYSSASSAENCVMVCADGGDWGYPGAGTTITETGILEAVGCYTIVDDRLMDICFCNDAASPIARSYISSCIHNCCLIPSANCSGSATQIQQISGLEGIYTDYCARVSVPSTVTKTTGRSTTTSQVQITSPATLPSCGRSLPCLLLTFSTHDSLVWSEK
jgi:hypothetical protein